MPAGPTDDVEAQLADLMAGADYGDAALAGAMRAELRERLAEGRPLTVYLGCDPTTPNLHLGHAVVLEALARFQARGHRVVFVIGDFTAMIGDPTGRSKTRPPLSREEVRANARTYAEQVHRILDPARCEIVFNSEWLAPRTLREVVELVSGFTVAQMLVRDDFKTRFEAGTPIHLHEVLYALTMGWDAAHLKTDVEVGGLDQLVNILVGRDVMRNEGLRPLIPLTFPLLPGTDGRLKMSKSHGNDIGLTIPPADMYGKVMSIPDDAMPAYFRLASGLPSEEVEATLARLSSGALHPRDGKMKLARGITGRWHGEAAAAEAEASFVTQFQRGGVPDDVPELVVGEAIATVLDLVMATGAVKSRSDGRRLVDAGAVHLEDDRLGAWAAPVPAFRDGAVLRVGKRHVHRLRRR